MVRKSIIFISALTLILAACSARGAQDASGKLKVLATTSIVGDVVAQVGGEHISLTVLLPLGADPHTFEPRPQDAAAIADADLVFANGAGLEEFLHPLLESAGAEEELVEVSEGIALLPFEEHNHEGEKHEHEGGDPHTWMDPNNVITWVDNISAALSATDPAHAADYKVNAEAYAASLRDMDAWIRSEVTQVPTQNRGLVSDHAVLGYFAEKYGFEQIGTITGSFSTGASPSAQELAALEDDIHNFGVKAVFVSATVNPALPAQVAQDTGVKLVTLYHASLSAPGGEADSYVKLMRYNVSAIVEALK